MPHPLVLQLRFTRSEFQRALVETIPMWVLASRSFPAQARALFLTDEDTTDKRFLGACC